MDVQKQRRSNNPQLLDMGNHPLLQYQHHTCNLAQKASLCKVVINEGPT